MHDICQYKGEIIMRKIIVLIAVISAVCSCQNKPLDEGERSYFKASELDHVAYQEFIRNQPDYHGHSRGKFDFRR